MDLMELIDRQRAFSARAFGPGYEPNRIVDHLGKELVEVGASGGDLSEWADIVLLALDGAWRADFSSREIAESVCVRFADVGREAFWCGESLCLVEHVRRQREHLFRDGRPQHSLRARLLTLRFEITRPELLNGSLSSWVRIVLLGLAGACVTGASHSDIVNAVVSKLAINERRQWPDWRSADPGQAIEHIRTGGA